jgi:hypothetical protein
MMWSPAVECRQDGSSSREHASADENIDLGRDLVPRADSAAALDASAQAEAGGEAQGMDAKDANATEAAEAGTANVVELQPHESPSPLPPSSMHWQQPPSASATGIGSKERRATDGASAAWQGFQQQTGSAMAGPASGTRGAASSKAAQAHESPAASNLTLPHLNAAASTPRMFGAQAAERCCFEWLQCNAVTLQLVE